MCKPGKRRGLAMGRLSVGERGLGMGGGKQRVNLGSSKERNPAAPKAPPLKRVQK